MVAQAPPFGEDQDPRPRTRPRDPVLDELPHQDRILVPIFETLDVQGRRPSRVRAPEGCTERPQRRRIHANVE